MNALSKVKKYFYTAALAGILISAGLIMIKNTQSYPMQNAYDIEAHTEALEYFSNLRNWNFNIPDSSKLSYTPSLYYFTVGKIHGIIEYVTKSDFNTSYTAASFHLLIFILIGYLFIFKLAPKIFKDKKVILFFSICLFVIPNLYLSQVMPRADHLSFLGISLLFYLWIYYNFNQKLAHSWKRILIWSVLLILIGNTRHLAMPAFIIFFLFGVILIFKDIFKSFQSNKLKYLVLILFVLLTFFISIQFYFFSFVRSGKIIPSATSGDTYTLNYIETSKYQPLKLKFEMLFNFEFNKILQTPNRNAVFGDGIINTKNIHSDLYTKIYNNIPKPELKTDFNNFYELEENENTYKLKAGVSPSEEIEIKAIINSAINSNNSFWPRFYNDMWADHWLYFSGPRIVEQKENLKQAVLIFAIPFSIVYFLSPLLFAVKAIVQILKRRNLTYYHLAGLIYTLGLSAYVFFTIFGLSELGKNSIVKFIYMLGYIYLPIICMARLAEINKRFILLSLIYIVILFILGLGLYLY